MITYTKLADGSWGVRSSSMIRPGSVVIVEKKDGTAKQETIENVSIDPRGGFIATIVRKTRDSVPTQSVQVEQVSQTNPPAISENPDPTVLALIKLVVSLESRVKSLEDRLQIPDAPIEQSVGGSWKE